MASHAGVPLERPEWELTMEACCFCHHRCRCRCNSFRESRQKSFPHFPCRAKPPMGRVVGGAMQRLLKWIAGGAMQRLLKPAHANKMPRLPSNVPISPFYVLSWRHPSRRAAIVCGVVVDGNLRIPRHFEPNVLRISAMEEAVCEQGERPRHNGADNNAFSQSITIL